MAIVSISEAAKLTGKNRSTLHRHIATGKLSRVANENGIDTAELLRVYGALKHVAMQHVEKNEKQQKEIVEIIHVVADLEKDKKHLKELLEAKEVYIVSLEKQNNVLADALKSTSLLLEDKTRKNKNASNEEPKGFFRRFFHL